MCFEQNKTISLKYQSTPATPKTSHLKGRTEFLHLPSSFFPSLVHDPTPLCSFHYHPFAFFATPVCLSTLSSHSFYSSIFNPVFLLLSLYTCPSLIRHHPRLLSLQLSSCPYVSFFFAPINLTTTTINWCGIKAWGAPEGILLSTSDKCQWSLLSFEDGWALSVKQPRVLSPS